MKFAMFGIVGFCSATAFASEPVTSTPGEPARSVAPQQIDYSAPWTVTELPAVRSAGTGWEKYAVSKDGSGFVRYTTPAGTQAALQVDACAQDTWCCTGGNEICYLDRSSNVDDELQLTLEGSRSIACTLLANENDTAEKVYFGTDAGNGTQSGKPAFILRKEGGTSNGPLTPFESYSVICF